MIMIMFMIKEPGSNPDTIQFIQLLVCEVRTAKKKERRKKKSVEKVCFKKMSICGYLVLDGVLELSSSVCLFKTGNTPKEVLQS